MMLPKLAVIWALLTLAAAGMYSKTNVIEVTAKNFKREVLQNGNVTVVEFYAPWCGHCQNLAPQYAKSARMLNGLARVVAVNCDREVNKGLCQKYDVRGFPTIKVFQPAKLTDVDFKDAVQDKPVPVRRPRVFDYNGIREAKAINTFAISKLRNYAASLVNEQAITWLKPNKIPRVIMLPGKKYKSKSIAPLFKVLSREYFGVLRFAYIPRRIDGAWNLLNLEAPEESQLVYLSDDREPLVYKGAMTKKALKKFLDEQYSFEMLRRQHVGTPQRPEREEAANGLEWILEDPQENEMEHVAAKRRELEHEEHIWKEAAESARKRLGKNEAVANSEDQASSSSATISQSVHDSGPTPTVVVSDYGHEVADFVYEGADEITDAEDDLDVNDGQFAFNDGNAKGTEDEDQDEDEDENYGVEIDFGDDASDAEALLDEVDVELRPEDTVEEGPEAISKYREMMESQRAALGTQTETNAQPSTTSEAVHFDDGLPDMDSLMTYCIRQERDCVLLTTPGGEYKREDLVVLMRSRERVPRKLWSDLNFFFVDDGANHEFDDFLSDIKLAPYARQRKAENGTDYHYPGLVYFSGRRRTLSKMNGDFTAIDIARFIVDNHNRKAPTEAVPDRWWYWVTEAALARMDALKREENGHDEL